MKRILFAWFVLSTTISFSQSNPSLKLWYKQPSGTTWENALPIGNGRLGAMVYGNVDTETVQLNEHTLWSGSPNRNDNPLVLDSLKEIRQLIFEGKQKDAEHMANRIIVSKKSHGQMFEPAGNLQLVFNGHNNYSDYYRELDIERAVAKTTYKVNDVSFTRQVLASFPERVIVIRLTASKPKSISFTAYYAALQKNIEVKASSLKQLSFSGTTVDHEGVKGMVKFKGIVQANMQGGTYNFTDTSMIIKDADAVTLYISIATNFTNYHDISGNENERAEAYLNKAIKKPFAQILNEHVKAYQNYFNRVSLNLGVTDAAMLATDERLKNFTSVNDPQFVTLYYQFGRYLLISSSQPGGQPATLQGIWNNKPRPPWDSKYTININTEMNYWPAEKTALPEMHEPLIQMVKDLAVTGQQTAKDMYGTRGWMAHHNTDIWRINGAVDGAFWGAWVNGGAWLGLHLWDRYLYNGDKKFLAAIYPVLRGAALFYYDFLIEHPKYKWLVIAPDEGGFICTSSKAEGPWEIKKLPKGFYDPGLFFDEDGRIYVAHGYSKISITELNADLSPKTNDSLVYTGDIRRGLEGSHVYKINSYYYLYATYGGRDGIQVALRSKNIYGPFEQKVVIRDTTAGINFGIHQGALIQTQTGEWWTMLFVDSGPFGRFPSLQPVTWIDGWPMVGVKGKAVITYKKPNVGKTFPIKTFPTSDDFNNKTLGMQWGWNHNPDNENWSLTKRKGYLRLTTARLDSNLRKARNTLTQRPFASYDGKPTIATTKMEIKNIKEGDMAGLAIFQEPYAFIGVTKMNGNPYIIMVNNGKTIDSLPSNNKTIYLRTIASNKASKASFEYSFDNKTFSKLGNELSMRFSLSIFTGNKFCLFNYATKTTGGFVDFDWFKTK